MWIVSILLPFISFCIQTNNQPESANIPNFVVLKTDLKLDPQKGKWYYRDQPFSGFAIKKYENGGLEQKVGYYEGKKQGVAVSWYPDGRLAAQKYYRRNQLTGTATTWWQNGNRSSESNYLNRKRHGSQKKWHANGQLARWANYVHGQEQGLQKAWLKNGVLYVNYEAKNGRIFGLKRTNLCYELNDEVIQFKK